MSSTQPLYYIGPPGPAREAFLAMNGEVRVFSDAGAFRETEGKPAGLVVVHEEHRGSALTLAAELGEDGPGWVVALASGDDPPVLRSVSVGLPHGLEGLREHLAGDVGEKQALVDLREALRQIGRTRHDVNNPLTAALAEVQILLMDAVEGSEEHESLMVIQAQLRRIRDLVAATSHLRLPRE